MPDERLIQRLQEQLAQANNRALESDVEIESLRAQLAKHDQRDQARELAEERLKAMTERYSAAEQNASAAQRKLQQSESAVLRLEEQLEKKTAELELARAEADKFAELNADRDGEARRGSVRVSAVKLAAVNARIDQLNTLVTEIRANPVALAAFADRLVRDYLDREGEEIRLALDELEEA